MRQFFKKMTIAAIMAMVATTMSSAHDIKAGDLTITGMWSRATPGGAKVAGGYLTIQNGGTAADRLISATSPASGKVEVHQMSVANGVMTMRPLDAGLVVDAGKSVTLAPGGLHLMLTDLIQPLKEGELLPIVLQFEKAGNVEVTLHIRAVGAAAPASEAAKGEGGHNHGGGKM